MFSSAVPNLMFDRRKFAYTTSTGQNLAFLTFDSFWTSEPSYEISIALQIRVALAHGLIE